MPTADAGNLSDLVVRCSRDLHRASQKTQAFNFLLFESDLAGDGKSEKPGGNWIRALGGFCDLTKKRRRNNG